MGDTGAAFLAAASSMFVAYAAVPDIEENCLWFFHLSVEMVR
jgi:hypothetical protein